MFNSWERRDCWFYVSFKTQLSVISSFKSLSPFIAFLLHSQTWTPPLSSISSVLSLPPYSHSFICWATSPWTCPCCPGLSVCFPGSFWHWVIGGKAFCTFGPFLPSQLPWQAGSGKGIDCYWIMPLDLWHLQTWGADIPYQLCLPFSDPKPEDEVDGLELHSCCSSSFSDVFLFVPWLLWWEQGDLERLTATRASLSSWKLLQVASSEKVDFMCRQLQIDEMPGRDRKSVV